MPVVTPTASAAEGRFPFVNFVLERLYEDLDNSDEHFLIISRKVGNQPSLVPQQLLDLLELLVHEAPLADHLCTLAAAVKRGRKLIRVAILLLEALRLSLLLDCEMHSLAGSPARLN